MVSSHIVELSCHNKGFGVLGFVDVVNFGFDDDIVAVVFSAVTLGMLVLFSVIEVDNVT